MMPRCVTRIQVVAIAACIWCQLTGTRAVSVHNNQISAVNIHRTTASSVTAGNPDHKTANMNDIRRIDDVAMVKKGMDQRVFYNESNSETSESGDVFVNKPEFQIHNENVLETNTLTKSGGHQRQFLDDGHTAMFNFFTKKVSVNVSNGHNSITEGHTKTKLNVRISHFDGSDKLNKSRVYSNNIYTNIPITSENRSYVEEKSQGTGPEFDTSQKNTVVSRKKRNGHCGSLSQRALCPWRYEIIRNVSRSPMNVQVVVCESERYQSSNSNIECHPLLQPRRFKLRHCTPDHYSDCVDIIDIQVGCVATLPCVLNAMVG